jgi:hypothetical protein
MGFTILKYSSSSGKADQQQGLWEADYLAPNTVYSGEYDASRWIYRLGVKIKFKTVGTGFWPPVLFAIMYRGGSRQDVTPVRTLVPALFGDNNSNPSIETTSELFDADPKKYMSKYQCAVQQPNPGSLLAGTLHYGYLQLDYRYSSLNWTKGLHTMELYVGTGKQKGKADTWSDPITCLWDITRYIPPSAT